MQISFEVYQWLVTALWFFMAYVSWVILRYIATSVCRDDMLKALDKGKKFYAFQRKFCGVHPIENRPL